MQSFLGLLVSFVLGTLVAVAELISRYRDRPLAAIQTPGAVLYLALNGIASVSALWIAHLFNLTFGATGTAVEPTRVLIASFAAIAFFRTSLFVTHVGDSDVGIGPSTVLMTLLKAADRSVDRKRAIRRSTEVAELMDSVSFEKAHLSLPTLCLTLLQNVPAEEQERLGVDIRAFHAAAMSDRQRSLALGLKLMYLAGPDVLRAAILALGDEIKRTD